MTRVSVAVAVHDDAEYVGGALDSVLSQIGPEDEVVVVDDGSTDDTPDVLAAYGDRIRVLRPGRVGLSGARNRGIAASRGRYLTFIDADDLWPAGSLEAKLRALDGSSADVVVGLTEEFLDEAVDDPGRHGLRAASECVRGWFLGAVLAHRDAFAKIPFDEEQPLAITVDWLPRAREAGLTFEAFEAVTLRRRIRPGSMTTDADGYHKALLSALRANIGARRGPG